MYYSGNGQPDTNEGDPFWWSGESNSDVLNELDDEGTVVIIEETDTYIEGTFHFKAFSSPGNSRTIKDGKFRVAVTRDNAPVSSDVTEYFEAKFDIGYFFVEDKNESKDDDSIQGKYEYVSGTNEWSLNFFAKNFNGELIEILISDYRGPGTYSTGSNDTKSFMYYSLQGKQNPNSSINTWWSGKSSSAEMDKLDDSGTVVITKETDTYIEGTFSFTGYQDPDNFATIQAGKFKVAAKR